MSTGAGGGLRIAHPLVDDLVDGIAVTRSEAAVTSFGEARADFLREAALAGVRPVVLTTDSGRITAPLAEMVSRTGGAWLAEQPGGGYVDGLTGRVLGSVSEAFEEPGPGARVSIAPAPLGRIDDPLVLTVSMSVRRQATEQTLLGGPFEQLADIAGTPPVGWSTTEPAGLHWNRANLTRFARGRMPRDSRLVVAAASGMIATTSIQRSPKGVDETIRARILLGRDEQEARPALGRVVDAFARIARAPVAILGSAFLERGPADLTLRAGEIAVPVPVAVLLGPAAVRDLGIDLAEAEERFGALRVGQPRLPSLVASFTGDGAADSAGAVVGAGSWEQARRFAESLGVTDVLRALGREDDGTAGSRGGLPWSAS